MSFAGLKSLGADMIVLGSVAIAAWFLWNEGGAVRLDGGGPKRPAELILTLYGEKQQPWLVEQIHSGDLIRAASTNVLLGRVSRVQINPATEITPTADGRLLASRLPGRVDALLFLECRAETTGDVMKVGQLPLLIGDDLAIKSQRYTLKTAIYDLTEAP